MIKYYIVCAHSRMCIILDIFFRNSKTCSILTKTNRRLQTRYVEISIYYFYYYAYLMYSIWFTLTFASPNRKQRNRQYIVNLIQVQSKKTLRNYKKCLMQWENPFQFSPMKICMGKCYPHNNPQLRLLILFCLKTDFLFFTTSIILSK